MEAISTAVGLMTGPTYWAAMFGAVGLALLASVIPGVNSFLVMGLAFPFILFQIEDPAIGLVMLATITGVDNTLDSIPAVLLGQPSAATQVTFLEGHQLARQGYAAHTLGAIYAVSAMGGIVGAIVLTIAIPVARPFVLRFSFSEIAATGMVGLAMVAVLSRGALVKGLIAAVVGMLLGLVGSFGRLTVDPFVAMPLIPFVLGLFALPEIIDLTLSRRPVAASGAVISNAEVMRGARYGVSRWRMTLRQSLFGVFLGAIPGVGSAVIDWLSYAFGILWTKDKSGFGKGSLDGVLFAEAAQNAKEGGQAIPTLTLGIPGGPTWALVVTAMIVYGVAPGPNMVGADAHITVLLVMTLALANLTITGVGLLVTGQLARLTTVPYPIVGSIIIPVLLLSAFVDTTSWRGIQVALGVGAMGILMKRYGWPRPPMILGFVLAGVIESNFYSAMNVHGMVGAFTRPVTLVILAIALIIGVLLFRTVLRLEREGALAPELQGEPVSWSVGLRQRFFSGEVLIPAVLALAGVYLLDAAIDTTPVPLRWQLFPTWLAIFMIAFSLLEMANALRSRRRQSALMDLGMLSVGVEGFGRAAVRVGVMFAVFLLVGTTI
ncbi:MAG: tripartite tricarboxylate transporter permease, partial [Dehalococcoidia bacterium]